MSLYIVKRTITNDDVGYLKLNFKWMSTIEQASKLTKEQLKKQKDNNFYITVGDIEVIELKYEALVKGKDLIEGRHSIILKDRTLDILSDKEGYYNHTQLKIIVFDTKTEKVKYFTYRPNAIYNVIDNG